MKDVDSSILLKESDPLLSQDTFVVKSRRVGGTDYFPSSSVQRNDTLESDSSEFYSDGEYDGEEMGSSRSISSASSIHRKVAIAIGVSLIVMGVIAVVTWSHAVGKSIGRTRLKVIQSQYSVQSGAGKFT